MILTAPSVDNWAGYLAHVQAFVVTFFLLVWMQKGVEERRGRNKPTSRRASGLNNTSAQPADRVAQLPNNGPSSAGGKDTLRVAADRLKKRIVEVATSNLPALVAATEDKLNRNSKTVAANNDHTRSMKMKSAAQLRKEDPPAGDSECDSFVGLSRDGLQAGGTNTSVAEAPTGQPGEANKGDPALSSGQMIEFWDWDWDGDIATMNTTPTTNTSSTSKPGRGGATEISEDDEEKKKPATAAISKNELNSNPTTAATGNEHIDSMIMKSAVQPLRQGPPAESECDGFVPSHRLMQLFPLLDLLEAEMLLSRAGVPYPNKRRYNVDEGTRFAIQSLVDDLKGEFFSEVDEDHELVMECPCCFEDCPVDQFIWCRLGEHAYCTSCIQSHAEELVFGSGRLGIRREEEVFELSCIEASCRSTFSQNELQGALPEKVLARYGELQGTLNVAKAELNDLHSCPKCGFQATLWQEETVFRCPNEDCCHASCTKCGRPGHLPLSCSESKAKQRDDCRLKTEEAMTNAFVRKCPNPKCGMPIVKDKGCNKLKCSCGFMMCNVCKEQINGYDHFCSTFDCQHETCGRCGLWSSTEKEDEQAIQEAFRKGQEEAQKLGVAEDAVQAAVAEEVLNRKGGRKNPARRFRIFRRRRRRPLPS